MHLNHDFSESELRFKPKFAESELEPPSNSPNYERNVSFALAPGTDRLGISGGFQSSVGGSQTIIAHRHNYYPDPHGNRVDAPANKYGLVNISDVHVHIDIHCGDFKCWVISIGLFVIIIGCMRRAIIVT